MKLHGMFAGTHSVAAALGAASVWFALSAGSAASRGAIVGAAAAAVVVAGVGAGWVVRRGLRRVEEAASRGGDAPEPSTGFREFDQTIERVHAFTRRWADAAANNRQLARDIDELLSLLNRRGDPSSIDRSVPAATQLRRLLSSLAGAVDADLDQILTYSGDADRATQEIAAGTEDQSEAVSKTTTYVEQMSVQFDSVAENANAAQRSAEDARESASSAQAMMEDLKQSVERLRFRVEGAERKLRALGERSQEIGSIVETIGAISSRTDLLALNASIESFRAGEQGRGFSVVAEEVRKLAEQAAQATQEVSTLIESIQSETQESIRSMAEQRADVDAEIERIQATENQLVRIAGTCNSSAERVREIARLAGHQFHLTQELVTAVERISEAARQNRSRAEGVGWTMRTVGKLTRKLDEALEPLRGFSAETRERSRAGRPEHLDGEPRRERSAEGDYERPSPAANRPAVAVAGNAER